MWFLDPERFKGPFVSDSLRHGLSSISPLNSQPCLSFSQPCPFPEKGTFWWEWGAGAPQLGQFLHLYCRCRSRPCKRAFLVIIILWSKGCIHYFFFLLLKLRKGGKQNIFIIIQAIRLHKRFHSFLHQTWTVETTNSVFAAIKHSWQNKRKRERENNKIHFPFARNL